MYVITKNRFLCERSKKLTFDPDVRLISFSITEKVKDVRKAKKDSKTVTCDIQYVEYEATFNRNLWQVAAEKISGSQKEAAEDFVDNGTIDIDP